MLMSMMLLFAAISNGQTAGFNETYLVLQVNNGGNTYYDLQASTANPDFNGANLGSFCGSNANALVFKGAEHKVYKCGGCDLQSTRVYYRIYPSGSASGTFVSNNIGYSSGFGNGCGGEDQTWSNTSYNTNLLAGLMPGTYTLEVYSDATTTCQGGTVYASNGGANYTATFTVTGTAYYADNDADGFGNPAMMQVSCTGAPAGYVTNNSDCNDNLIYYVDNDGDGFGSTAFSPCAGVTNSTDCDDNLLTYVDNDNDGFGSTVFAPCGPSNDDDCNDNMIMYVDQDEDGFGSTAFAACDGVNNNDDCDDLNVTYQDLDGDGFGYQVWVPCGVLNNFDCDDNQVLYVDMDFDGFGTTDFAPCFGATNSLDCDDDLITFVDDDGDGFGTEDLSPCSGVTNTDDCDDTMMTYFDGDGDGYGTEVLVPCGQPLTGDCDDNNFDLVGIFTFYADADNDGYGTGEGVEICAAGATSPPAGFAQFGGDCNDDEWAISPGRDEVYYNGIDDNCDGNLDEGNQLLSEIVPSQCGATLPTISTLIMAESFNNSTQYRFEVTNTSTGEVQILDRPLRWFGLTMLNDYDYSTTYSIRVQLQYNGTWLGYYGEPCLISTPDVIAPGGPAQVAPTQCGSTLPTISTLIAASSIPNATGYRFRITNMSDPSAPNQVQTLDRTLHWFALTMLPTYAYGTTYMLEVAVKTTGDYTDYGSPCTITTPAVPGIMNCGGTVASASEIVSTMSMNNVSMYRFELTNLQTNAVMTLDRTVQWFRFNMLPGYDANAQYGVRVALRTGNTWSQYGPACTITAPGMTREGDVKTPAIAWEAKAYPNPFTSEFTLETTVNADVRVYDMTGRLIDSITASEGNAIMIGAGYPSGIYNVIVTDGQTSKTIRMIKR